MNQAEFAREYNDSHREQFNDEFFERDNEELVRSLESVVRCIERDKYFTLKLVDFSAIYNYEEIYNTLRYQEESRRRKHDKSDNSYDFIKIKDSDIILCKLKWYICHNDIERQEIDGKTVMVNNPEQILEVLVALPRFVNKYHFRISGNLYSTTFQIIDGSTYNNSNANKSKSDTVTMKTMFAPIKLFRVFKDIKECNTNTSMKILEYSSTIFNTPATCMYYIFAKYGLYGAARFLGIDCVLLSNVRNTNPEYYCFENNGIYISCPKICFQDYMVQSFISTINTAIMKNTTLNDLFNHRYWLKNLGMAYKNATVDKGLFILDSIDSIYDDITRRDTHLPEEDKRDIYTILRWLMREFSQLRIKENVDVTTKRIRLADYISAIYATKINQGMRRLSEMGRSVTLKKIVQAIYTDPMYILKNLSTPSMTNLICFRDMVNDGDYTLALKYTYKGISGLGEDNTQIQPMYRYIDPSHVGILDLDSSTNSDPGMSGMICPMTKLYGGNHSFSEYEEPNTWAEQFKPIHDEYMNTIHNGISPVTFTKETPYDYDSSLKQIEDEELAIHRVTCPVYNVNDPTVLYTVGGYNPMDGRKANVIKKSLFTIRDDSDDISEEEAKLFSNDTYNDFDDDYQAD